MPDRMLNWLSAILSMAKIVWRSVECQEVDREASGWQRAMNVQVAIYIPIQCHQSFANRLATTNVPTKNLRAKLTYQWGAYQPCYRFVIVTVYNSYLDSGCITDGCKTHGIRKPVALLAGQ